MLGKWSLYKLREDLEKGLEGQMWLLGIMG